MVHGARSSPPPRQHTLRYAGVLAAAAKWRAAIDAAAPPPADAAAAAPVPPLTETHSFAACAAHPPLQVSALVELLRRTFAEDLEACPSLRGSCGHGSCRCARSCSARRSRSPARRQGQNSCTAATLSSSPLLDISEKVRGGG